MWSANDVRQLREQMGLERADFARILGVDVRTVVRWENDRERTRPTGAAEQVLNGLREKLSKDPDKTNEVLKFLVGAAAVGGLAYLIVKLLDAATEE